MNILLPIPGAPKMKATYVLTETGDGTAVQMRIARPRSAKDRAFVEGVLPGLGPILQAGIAALGPLLADEMTRRRAAAAEAPEPDVPVSVGRYLEPVDSEFVRSS
jgi:hypothetical protein